MNHDYILPAGGDASIKSFAHQLGPLNTQLLPKATSFTYIVILLFIGLPCRPVQSIKPVLYTLHIQLHTKTNWSDVS